MKHDLTSHINDWSFGNLDKNSFVDIYDFLIVIGILSLLYYIIF